MNTIKRRVKREYPDKLKELSANLIKTITDFIPYNYVARVVDILEKNNSQQLANENIKRKIQLVRKGTIGDIEIAKALYQLGKEEKNKFDEIEKLTIAEP